MLRLSCLSAPVQARKPYTITKQRERWTDHEHELFVEALELHGRCTPALQEQARCAVLALRGRVATYASLTGRAGQHERSDYTTLKGRSSHQEPVRSKALL